MVSLVNSPVQRPDARLYEVIRGLGLTSGLVLCLDAGDIDSYDGSAQTWIDRAAGNNFFRGTSLAANAEDPTFNGVAGAKSAAEYFSFDGGDRFTENFTHAYADDWHKNNGAFTLLAVPYIGASKAALSQVFNCTGQQTTGAPGVSMYINAADTLSLFHAIDDAGSAEVLTSAATVALNSWNMVAAAFNEATPAADLVINATAEAFVPTVSTATAAKAASVRLCGRSAGDNFESGERLACFAAWSSKLTTAQIAAIYTTLKAVRFPTLP